MSDRTSKLIEDTLTEMSHDIAQLREEAYRALWKHLDSKGRILFDKYIKTRDKQDKNRRLLRLHRLKTQLTTECEDLLDAKL